MRNKRQKSNWDRWENVKAAHAKNIAGKIAREGERKIKRGIEWK